MGDWTPLRAKVEAEGRCRLCGRTDRKLEAAHVIPRSLGGGWTPDDVVPLCGPVTDPATCHGKYDALEVDLSPALTPAELRRAVQVTGSAFRAARRIAPVAWRERTSTRPRAA